MRDQRYLVTKLSDLDYIVSDTEVPQDTRLYSLMIRPVRYQWYSHQVILTVFDATQSSDQDWACLEREIWSTMVYTDDHGIKRLGTRILNSLEVEEAHIEYPYELTFRYGGSVTLTL